MVALILTEAYKMKLTPYPVTVLKSKLGPYRVPLLGIGIGAVGAFNVFTFHWL